jgi:hypothetical protein
LVQVQAINELLSLWEPKPWTRFTAGLIAAMFVGRGLDLLSTRLVTPETGAGGQPVLIPGS